jgi:hypothetical protein
MAQTFYGYLTWEDLFGVVPTQAEVLDEIQKMDGLNTALLLSRLSILQFVDRSRNISSETLDLQGCLAVKFLDDELLRGAQAKFGRERMDRWRAFHAQQILTLLKWAVLYGAEQNGSHPDFEQKTLYTLGRCLIKTSDLLLSPEMRRPDGKTKRDRNFKNFLRLQLQAGACFEINNPPPILNSAVRSDLIFGDILKKETLPLDVPGQFRAQTGLRLDAYVDMLIAILAHYITKTQKELAEDPSLAVINPMTFFGPLAAEQAESFWALEAASLGDIRAGLMRDSGPKPHHDFIPLRERPFIKINETAVMCVNPGFVSRKTRGRSFLVNRKSARRIRQESDVRQLGSLVPELCELLAEHRCQS